ncbi:hypothetical protein [Phenylobacterium sp.]|jgi:hypothetical protein|uniref:hypothetical protein n=1 Tax=Phenylobacterium sp. TaxID=1871053 RepID=UPI002E310E47|nr:hypothetical protein [Phenylobacterium sp.]HEX4709442.1 hypothetical protein [Phenylobacterium sp.]
MPGLLKRLIGHKGDIPRTAALGRVFNVTRQTWRLSDDPVKVGPTREPLTTGKTASEAADFARAAAAGFPRHGFHRPSGSWWAVEGEWFHRFAVHTAPKRKAAILLVATGLAGVAAVAVARRRSRGS